MSDSRKLVLYCDGASRGNPGPGSYGYVIYESGAVVAQGSQVLGSVTNNVAEYEGVLQGLTHCRTLNATEVTVRSDSQLLVRQLNGQYKIKAAHIIPLAQKAKLLLAGFKKTQIEHIPREENKLADKLANEALDGNPT